MSATEEVQLEITDPNEPVVKEQDQKKQPKMLKEKKIYDIFSKAMLTKSVYIHMKYVGNSLKPNIEKVLVEQFEGKCIKEGYIKPDSIKLMNYSSGLITDDGIHIKFEVMFETLVCYPVEGMLIECTASTVTKAGIKAEIKKYKAYFYALVTLVGLGALKVIIDILTK